jgi:hypothetical protein
LPYHLFRFDAFASSCASANVDAGTQKSWKARHSAGFYLATSLRLKSFALRSSVHKPRGWNGFLLDDLMLGLDLPQMKNGWKLECKRCRSAREVAANVVHKKLCHQLLSPLGYHKLIRPSPGVPRRLQRPLRPQPLHIHLGQPHGQGGRPDPFIPQVSRLRLGNRTALPLRRPQ